jgi:outer membrane lipoprotein-sorting protein
MLRKVLVGLATAALAAPVFAQTVDEVIARACEARGGVARIKAVQSVRMTGHMTMGPGAEAPITLEMKRPRSTRMEFTAQGQTGVQAYDGKQAWGIAPMGSRKPEPLPDEMARNIDAQADLDGPLVDYKAKGHQVELVGKETVDGLQAWKLKLTPKGGDVVYVFLDASSFLEIRNETHRLVRGQELDILSTFSDFKESGGVVWPHRIQAGPKGRPEKQVLSFDKIEVNVPIDDARFKMPPR